VALRAAEVDLFPGSRNLRDESGSEWVGAGEIGDFCVDDAQCDTGDGVFFLAAVAGGRAGGANYFINKTRKS
jgi:hypothetical protein